MPPTVRNQNLPDRKREFDQVRRREQPWRAFYKTKDWFRRRAAQLKAQPLCERCLARGIVEPATVANHTVRHRGDWDLFIAGELESVCKRCHDRDIQREERAADRSTALARGR